MRKVREGKRKREREIRKEEKKIEGKRRRER